MDWTLLLFLGACAGRRRLTHVEGNNRDNLGVAACDGQRQQAPRRHGRATAAGRKLGCATGASVPRRQQTARRSGSKHLGWAWRRQDRCSWVGRGGI
uniref:Uncharacterized protein n=1 Tax=Oryza sativa subsp. japonica TaxID=39947 RepID=Q69J10_ORYSJ|nr:hypothetical protein [Oryza sativa Japonica Group]BAD34392.1 hypothetical protein [Oryza sativa Japonica Group]